MTTTRLVTGVVVVGLTVHAGPAGLLTGLTIAAVTELVGLRLAVARHNRSHRAARPAVGPDRRQVTSGGDLPSYRRIYNEISRGQRSRWDYDHGLRQRLQQIMAVRLIDHAGIDVDRHPDRARDRVGHDRWALLAPRRPAAGDREAAGISRTELGSLVDRLERL